MDIIKKAIDKLADMETDPALFWDEECHEAYDQMLDECLICETCGRGRSDLKHTDPIAYRCGFNDYFDRDVAVDFAKNQPAYKELVEKLEAANDAIAELEDALENT